MAEPIPMPEMGDWIRIGARIEMVYGPADGPVAVRTSGTPYYRLLSEIDEIRHKDGRIWRREEPR